MNSHFAVDIREAKLVPAVDGEASTKTLNGSEHQTVKFTWTLDKNETMISLYTKTPLTYSSAFFYGEESANAEQQLKEPQFLFEDCPVLNHQMAPLLMGPQKYDCYARLVGISGSESADEKKPRVRYIPAMLTNSSNDILDRCLEVWSKNFRRFSCTYYFSETVDPSQVMLYVRKIIKFEPADSTSK